MSEGLGEGGGCAAARSTGGMFARRAPGALLLDYVHPLETPLELGDPNCPSSRKLQTGVHSTTLAPLRAVLVNTLASWENGGLG